MRLLMAVVPTLLLVAPAFAEAEPVPGLLPAGKSWTELRLEARKGFLRGSATCTARRATGADVAAELKAWPAGGERPASDAVVVCDTVTSATFRGDARRTTWLDALGLLQDDGREGKKASVRRFGPSGFYLWRARGTGRNAVREERQASIEQGAAPRPLVDVATLLWLATAHQLHRDGAALDVAVLSKGRAIPLDLRAGDVEKIEVGHDETRRTVAARRVRIAPEDDETSLLGLRGDVDLYLDAETGLPLELRGKMDHLGFVRVRVLSVTAEP